MKILVIGSGGREHALVWKLAQGKQRNRIYCAPGNAGIASMAECVDIADHDIEGLLQFAQGEEIDLTVVGPEVPLTMGIVNVFREHGLKIFGPTKEAAELEGSKAFAKDLMAKYHIPTAAYGVFTDVTKAIAFLKKVGLPCVVKADGLAAGKGVLVCQREEEAKRAIQDILVDHVFGEAGSRVVIEEFLEGQEVSVLAFADGEHLVPMVSAQDHKRIFDQDKGLNTGGMGAYSPAPIYREEIREVVEKTVLSPILGAMKQEGREFSGVLYAGLMLTERGPMVLEFNVRFGDPETQAVLPRLEGDLAEIMLAVVEKRLDASMVSWSDEPCVCVVLASGGYPVTVEKGKVIGGLDEAGKQALVFHAGTRREEGHFVTNGGRVLGVSAKGSNLKAAIARAYEAVGEIHFEHMQYRRDIGKKAFG